MYKYNNRSKSGEDCLSFGAKKKEEQSLMYNMLSHFKRESMAGSCTTKNDRIVEVKIKPSFEVMWTKKSWEMSSCLCSKWLNNIR